MTDENEKVRRNARIPTVRPLTAIGSACLAAVLAAFVVVTTLVGAAPAGSDVDPGASQSPIDLRRSEITFVQRLPALRFEYPPRVDVTVTNTGSPDEETTVRADVPADAAAIKLRGTRYDLQQFHWHTPSEHKIGGRRSPMEMHLVHSAADGSLLVIGALIKQGRKNRVLEPIFKDLPEVAGQARSVPGVRIDGLLPDDLSSYRYVGSLTTPPFTEGVQWIVLARAITLSKRQIQAFREMFDEGNSRGVQALNGRRVVSDAARRRPD